MLKSGIGMQPYFCEMIIDESVQRQSLSVRYRSKNTWWFESIVMSIVCLRSFGRSLRRAAQLKRYVLQIVENEKHGTIQNIYITP